MARSIMILCGSPRAKGNTNTLVGWVAEAAAGAGANVEVVDAAHLDYKANGCTACMGCQKSEKFECVIEDEASDVLRRMAVADVLVFATPVYCFGPTAQLKLLLDRTFCLVKINPADGSRRQARDRDLCGLIATAGGGMDDGLGMVEQTFDAYGAFAGVEMANLLVPGAPMDPAQTARSADLKTKAEALGRKLAQ